MSLLADNGLVQDEKRPFQINSSYHSQRPPQCPSTPLSDIQESVSIRSTENNYQTPWPSLSCQSVDSHYWIDIAPGLRNTATEADQALKEYTEDFVPRFPFVPIPFGRAYDMYKQQPLLLKAILLTCRHQSFRSRTTGDRWFRETISHHVVVLGEKRLELLQAILIFIAW